jgi:hypothetical protein
MTPTQKFAAILRSEKIKYFSAREAFFLGASNARFKNNTIPEEYLWDNIIPTLKFLDTARERVGRLQLSSIYRNAAYNRSVGGARNSQHLAFRACDVQPLDTSVQDLWNVCVDIRRKLDFQGGLGRYNTFVHVDCRGSKATW